MGGPVETASAAPSLSLSISIFYLTQLPHVSIDPEHATLFEARSIPGSFDPNRNVKIIVVNVGSNLVASDDFSCLVDGDTRGYYNDFDELFGESDINRVRNEICERRIQSPTLQPSLNKTSSSTLNASPMSTSQPIDSPIDEVCEYNCFQVYTICILNGYKMSSSECKSMKESLKNVTQQTCPPKLDKLIQSQKEEAAGLIEDLM